MRCPLLFPLLVASCVATAADNAAVEETTNSTASRVDSHLFIRLGDSASVTDSTALFFSSITGPTTCDQGTCFVEPLTAQASLTRNGAETLLKLPHGQFVHRPPLALAYLGSQTNETGVPVGLFRVAEEVPSSQSFGTAFRLAVSSPAVLPNEKILRLTAFEDSRCPCDAVCVWEGLAEVEVTVFSKEAELGRVKFNDHMGKRPEWGAATTSVGALKLSSLGMRLPMECDGHDSYIDDGYIELEASE